MQEDIIKKIAQEQNIHVKQIENTLQLLEEGCTVPFIARYRKEMTHGLDEEQIRIIQEHYNYQVNLSKRKEEVLSRIETLGQINDDIRKMVEACTRLSQVEEIYRPYKQKKKTRASIAIANGLEPLSKLLLKTPRSFNEKEADQYLNEKVTSREEAIQGAMDIIAEKISNDMTIRNKILDSMNQFGRIMTSKKKNAEDEKMIYKNYYDYSEKISTLPNHRIMAIDRGEKEKVLNVSISINEEYHKEFASRLYIKNRKSPTAHYVEMAIEDGLKRLAYPSLERVVRNNLTERAQEASIDVFSDNLGKLLLQPPMKNKRILGFDPAFRTGCKLAVIDESGKKLIVDVIYPHKPNAKVLESEKKLVDLCKDYHVNLIAIGNGTASRESEAFVANTIKKYDLPVSYTIVSEAGASVYSASKLAIEEFPDLHVEQRSAISIARRLLDPLSELIKIDPQSIGVGQYQHDLPTARLKERLNFVVEKAVNLVGVDINTASPTLLKNISGLNQATAKSIVAYREENGKIMTRSEIKKIPKIGPKAFQQAAGFLRIAQGKEPLDNTSIHPESYKATKQILKALHLGMDDLGTDIAKKAAQQADKTALKELTGIDDYTLDDILSSITQPLRDYRDDYDGPILRQDVLTLEDLHINDKLEGTVRNVVDFGAFVDIGLHEDGLVHISKMSKQHVQHPSDVVSVGDSVTPWVYAIDEQRQKVQLTMIDPAK